MFEIRFRFPRIFRHNSREERRTATGHSQAGQETSHIQSTTGQGSQSQDSLLEKLKHESVRLQTFNDNWYIASPAVLPGALAKAGFCYFNEEDKVQCVFCFGVVKGFLPGDDVMAIHKDVFERCPFALGKEVGNVPIKQPKSSAAKLTLEALGIFVMPDSVYPDYKFETSRRDTFKDPKLPTPPVLSDKLNDKLVRAGFFYRGVSDQVVCYQCGTTVFGWRESDDPWQEHARSNENCPLLTFVKGPKFAASVVKAHGPRMGFSNGTGALSDFVIVSARSLENEESASGTPPQDREVARKSSSESVDSGYGGEETDSISVKSLEAGTDKVRSSECAVCWDARPTVVMLPCRHLCACVRCAIQNKECPLCREPVQATITCFIQ